MTIEDALNAMATIERTCDGSPKALARAADLMRELIEGDPAEFWETFFLRMNEDNPMRKWVEEFMRTGVVDENTTFADWFCIVKNEANMLRDRDGQK